MVQSLLHFSYGRTDLNDQEYIWRSQLSVHVFGMSVQPLCNTDYGPFSPSQQTCMLWNWRCQFSSSPSLGSSVHCTNSPGTEKLWRLKLHHLANRLNWLRSRWPQGKAHMAVWGTELNCTVWKLNWTAQSGNNWIAQRIKLCCWKALHYTACDLRLVCAVFWTVSCSLLSSCSLDCTKHFPAFSSIFISIKTGLQNILLERRNIFALFIICKWVICVYVCRSVKHDVWSDVRVSEVSPSLAEFGAGMFLFGCRFVNLNKILQVSVWWLFVMWLMA